MKKLDYLNRRRLFFHITVLSISSILAVSLTTKFNFLPVTANAQTACNVYSSGTPAPQSFGTAWNVLSAAKELLLNSNCQQSSVTFNPESGSSNQYIYKKGYYYTTSWQTFTFQGTPAQGSADRLVSNATYTLNSLPANTQYWVAYVCQWDTTAGKWKCGCSDSTCAQSYWQLQGAKPSGSGNGGGTNNGPLNFDFSTYTEDGWVAVHDPKFSSAGSFVQRSGYIENSYPAGTDTTKMFPGEVGYAMRVLKGVNALNAKAEMELQLIGMAAPSIFLRTKVTGNVHYEG